MRRREFSDMKWARREKDYKRDPKRRNNEENPKFEIQNPKSE
jgi:hypothetical protein